MVISWWAWPMMAVMVLAIMVVWSFCPAPAERWRSRLLLLLAIAMNVAGGHLMKEWGMKTEERLRVLESAQSSPSNHETMRQPR